MDKPNSSKLHGLLRYVLPSVGAMLVNALYSVVDGIFVGQGVGDSALAAVNLAMPTLGVVSAIAVMLVMGSATVASVSIGRGNTSRANAIFSNICFVVGILSIVLSALCLIFADRLAIWSGATGELVRLSATYIRSYLGFGFFFSSSFMLAVFVRNDGNPGLAFKGMAAGTLCNIFLDWLFIFPLQMGILGAGLASGLSTVLSFSILITHFLRKKGVLHLGKPKFNWAITKEISMRGFPEFVTQMYGPIIIFCYNLVILRIYGDPGLTAFSMLAYLLSIMTAMTSGVAQGVQPLIGRSFGAGEHENERFYFRTGMLINFCLAVFSYTLTVLIGKWAYHIFSSDESIIALAYAGTLTAGIGMILSTINVSHSGYFLATQRTKQALTLAVCRAFVFTPLFVLLTPVVLGSRAVWGGIVGSELCVALLAVTLYALLQRKKSAL